MTTKYDHNGDRMRTETEDDDDEDRDGMAYDKN